MGKRRRARECAVQCLYQWEVTGVDPDSILAGYWESQGPAEEAMKHFAEWLVVGAVSNSAEIDVMISEQMRHWRIDRLGLVEKSVLRLGVFELTHAEKTPAAVVIDEAVELTKRFSDPEAAAFVNGVLDAVSKRDIAPNAE